MQRFRRNLIRAPIPVQNAFPHKTVKGRMRPVAGGVHMTVFDRIVMDVIDVPRQVVLVAYLVLPIAPLPDAPLAFAPAAGIDAIDLFKPARKPHLDQRPARQHLSFVR